MTKFFYKAMIAIAICTLTSPASGRSTSLPPTQIQTPCHEIGFAGVQACVVTHRYFSGDQPVAHVTLTTAPSTPLKSRYQSIALINVYHLRRGLNDYIGVNVDNGKSGLVADVYANRPTYVWMSTRNGGRSWSNVTTTNMANVLSWP